MQISQGVVINHKNVNLISIQCLDKMNRQHEEKKSVPLLYRWKTDLYAIYNPFLMDSQASRIQRQLELQSGETLNTHEGFGVCKETSADKKRRKKRKRSLDNDESKIANVVRTCLSDLVAQGKELNILSEASHDVLRGSDNNTKARQSASLPSCGDLFQELCEASKITAGESERSLRLNKNDGPLVYNPSFIINKLVHNETDTGFFLNLGEHSFLIPPHSRFLTSNLSSLVSQLYSYLKVDDGYDLIVMDPPWTNKSVRRKKSYNTVLEEQLCTLPIQDWTKPGSLIIVWVTNNVRLETYVKETLFPCWNVHHEADWIWLKVTLFGEPVHDFDSHHKKPYEKVIIGKVLSPQIKPEFSGERNGSASNSSCSLVNNAATSGLDSPAKVDLSLDSYELPFHKDYVFLSVPCALHSKKPTLTDLLHAHLPSNPKCLELFARNLQPGWTSWGNEVAHALQPLLPFTMLSSLGNY